METTLIISAAVFLGVIVVIAFNLLDKALVSLIGATLMVFLGIMTMEDVFQSIEWNVIFLLIGLMIITGYFADSGLPAWIAAKLLKASGGRPRVLLGFMSYFSAFTSNFVDNTTTMLTFAPIAVSASRLIGMSVIPLLLTMGMSVNITGYGTMISDPPQIYLASVSGLGFNDWFIYKGRPSMFLYSNIAALCGAIAAVFVFRKQVPMKIDAGLSGQAGSVEIADRNLAIKSVGALLAVIVALALKRMTGLPEFAVAILFAGILVIIADRDFGKAISKVDWSTLLFLIGIFAMIGGLNKSGVIRLIAETLGGLVQTGGLFMAITVLMIFTLLTCSVIINVPYLIAMIAVVGRFASILGYDPVPLYMVLMAAGYSGSCTTMISAPSSMVGVSICRREGEDVSFARFIKAGVPYVLATLLPAYALIILFWVVAA